MLRLGELAQRVVGIAEMKAVSGGDGVLITYALGSCLGIALYDPVARVGGLLHSMLPESRIDPYRARANPARFIDTGVPHLFRACYALGARKERLRVYVAGGASTRDDGGDGFRIGRRNCVMLRKLLWTHAVIVHAEDVGGTSPRTMALEMRTGAVTIRTAGMETHL